MATQIKLLVSFGINNWQCAIASLSIDDLMLVPVGTSTYPTRYFRTENATLPVQVADGPNGLQWLRWERVRRAFGGSSEGYARVVDPCVCEDLIESGKVEEITVAEYQQAGSVAVA